MPKTRTERRHVMPDDDDGDEENDDERNDIEDLLNTPQKA